MRRTNVAAAVIILAAIVAPRIALAQGEDAMPMRPGTLRFSIGGVWSHASERFGAPSPLNPTLAAGARESLGVYYSSDSLGATQLEVLNPAQSQIRTMTGLAGYTMNLGRSNLTLDASVRHQPIRVDWAPSRRLGFSVAVPIVRARMSAFLLGPSPDTTAAAAKTRGNVGFNNEFLTAGAQDTFRFQADSALRSLATQAASGPPALRAQAQAELAALTPVLCGMSTLASPSAGDPTSPCFGGTAGAVTWSVLLPVTGSPAADSIAARYSRGQTSYAALQAQYAALGITLPPLSAVYHMPGAPLDSLQLRRFFSDPSGPIAADSLTEVVRTGIGDIEVGGWYQLAAGAKFRSQLAVTVRLPTGTMDNADNLIDIGTGDHQTDVEVASRNDVIVGRNLWFHVGGRYGLQLADQLERRVSPWYLPLAAAATTADVKRNLGDYLAIDLVPNLQLDDAFGFGIGWHYFHQGATTFEYVDPADQARIGVPADVLGQSTSVSRLRVGAGVTFNTLERYARGRARLPYRVTWSYNSTFWGKGGQVPKAGVMSLTIQAYFGNLR